MLLCNPSEPLTGGTGNASNFNPTAGQMFVFSLTGNTGGYSPGVFNLLDAPNGSGDQAIENYLSQQTPGVCSTAGTNPAQGQKTNAVYIGLNVRFDQQPSGNTTGLDQTPAPVKINGLSYKLNNKGQPNCNQNQICDASETGTSNNGFCSTTNTSMPLPIDCSLTQTGSSFIGTGTSDSHLLTNLQTYWSNHHSAAFPTGVTTRYGVYLAENVAGVTWKTDATEPHGPVCAPTSTEVPPEYVADRRVLHVAVVDCVYWGVQGNKTNNIPIGAYADFFLTHSVPKSGANPSNVLGAGPSCGAGPLQNNQVYTEFIRKHTLNDGTIIGGGGGGGSGANSIVQLVR
jgi:hypothetical protein